MSPTKSIVTLITLKQTGPAVFALLILRAFRAPKDCKTYEVEANENFKVIINNAFDETITSGNQKQEFTIMIREIGDVEHNFNEINVNKTETINYIQSNESQIFYFYANITGLQNLNTLNFKFDYRYFGQNMIKVLSKIISLDEEIKQEYLEDNVPDTNESYASYDMYSDEYYRIYKPQ